MFPGYYHIRHDGLDCVIWTQLKIIYRCICQLNNKRWYFLGFSQAIDIFMSACTMFVFASLMEYAIVTIILGDATLLEEERKKVLKTIKLPPIQIVVHFAYLFSQSAVYFIHHRLLNSYFRMEKAFQIWFRQSAPYRLVFKNVEVRPFVLTRYLDFSSLRLSSCLTLFIGRYTLNPSEHLATRFHICSALSCHAWQNGLSYLLTYQDNTLHFEHGSPLSERASSDTETLSQGS